MSFPRRRLIPLFALLTFALLFALPALMAKAADKVSHKGWPEVNGVFQQIKTGQDARLTGGGLNDELLGHHGSDSVTGGAGNDWIYPSHGRTRVIAGTGNDRVWAFYGRGTIDCGPGRDTVRVRMNGAFELKRCEVVNHFCAHGSDGRGGCLKPGEQRRR